MSYINFSIDNPADDSSSPCRPLFHIHVFKCFIFEFRDMIHFLSFLHMLLLNCVLQLTITFKQTCVVRQNIELLLKRKKIVRP